MAISTAIPLGAVARTVGYKTTYKNLRGGAVMLPQHIAVIGQGNTAATYSLEKRRVTSLKEIGDTYGYGSPLYLAGRELYSVSQSVGSIPVTIFPLEDAVSGDPSVGDITPSGTQTKTAEYQVIIGGVRSLVFSIAAADTVAARVTAITDAINGVLAMPVIATDSTTKVDLESKWKGASANDITISIVGDTTAGTSFAVTDMASGAVNPTVDDALLLFGNIWYTIVVNCLQPSDTTAIAAISSFGEGRWAPQVGRPFVSFIGSTETDVSTAIVLPESRKTDPVTSQIPVPGSPNLPCMIAAAAAAQVALTADSVPAHDYGSKKMKGLTPGNDEDQWDYNSRDLAVKSGCSTIEVKDGVVNLSDVVTFYHPTGEEPPAFRKVVTIMKLMNVLFNLDLIYKTEEWDGAPLVPDDQLVTEPTAKKPKMATAATSGMIDSLAQAAILSDPEAIKKTIVSGISETNPDRLDQSFTLQISGNACIISIDDNFGFYFGTVQPVA